MGDMATVFLSFAYDDNFIELVDSLKQSSIDDADNFHKDTTFYSFDMFVNNQWFAFGKDVDWWKTTFRNAIKKIGKTLCFFSSLEEPEPCIQRECGAYMRLAVATRFQFT